jgi:glycosyltransferase involved in cell wall biosynthesis
VAVVLSGYGVVRRGAEAMLEDLLPRLAPRFEVSVFSRSGAGPGGVRRAAIPRGLWEPVYLAARPLRKLLDTLYLDPLHVEWTSHLLLSLPALLRGRYDVVWHETGLWGGMLLGLLRRPGGYRLLDVAHSHALGWEVPFARRRPDLFVAQTETLAAEIRRRVAGLRVEVVAQGIDLAHFRPGADKWPLGLPAPVVLGVGALSPEKRPELLVEAVAESRCSLALVGEGPLAERVDRLGAERLGADRYRRLTVDRNEMPRLYAAADLVALASPREATGRSLVEAMACNKPVVSVDDAVRREVVGEAGFLVASDAAAGDWAAAFERAAGEEWADRPLRQSAPRTLERAVERFGDLLASLAQERR